MECAGTQLKHYMLDHHHSNIHQQEKRGTETGQESPTVRGFAQILIYNESQNQNVHTWQVSSRILVTFYSLVVGKTG